MNQKKSLLTTVLSIAIPVTLQCMLQSSFSIVDQIMIGQLGEASVAAIGLAGKFFGIYTVLVNAAASIAGIMISQYLGAKKQDEVNTSVSLGVTISIFLSIVFLLFAIFIPEKILSFYTQDSELFLPGAEYLMIISFSAIPVALTSIISSLVRCLEKATLPLYATIVSAVVNTVLNYLFIFGKLGFSPMGANGAAIATLVSHCVNMIFILVCVVFLYKKRGICYKFSLKLSKESLKQYLYMLVPLLVNEFVWILGENIYASIYGHIGTVACAAMTITYPIQGLLVGGLSGFSAAASIIVGKDLGKGDMIKAYEDSKKIIIYAVIGSALVSIFLIIIQDFYVSLYKIEDTTRDTAIKLLTAFAVICSVKVMNMVLGGGIIRSGGETKITLLIDLIGTWCFGVPLGLITAFVFNLSIEKVYFILSQEELVRLIISFFVFRRKKWMKQIS